MTCECKGRISRAGQRRRRQRQPLHSQCAIPNSLQCTGQGQTAHWVAVPGHRCSGAATSARRSSETSAGSACHCQLPGRLQGTAPRCRAAPPPRWLLPRKRRQLKRAGATVSYWNSMRHSVAAIAAGRLVAPSGGAVAAAAQAGAERLAAAAGHCQRRSNAAAAEGRPRRQVAAQG